MSYRPTKTTQTPSTIRTGGDAGASDWLPGCPEAVSAWLKQGIVRLDASFLTVQMLNGLTSASVLFITAAGLTIVFGVTRVVNFAHGSFYMLGAYLAARLAPVLSRLAGETMGFWGGVILSALVVGFVGIAFEVLVLRRVYKAPELYQMLATFAVVLVVADLVVLLFGRDDIFGMRAPGLRGAVALFGRRFPTYDLFLIAAGPILLLMLQGLLRLTRFGVLIRAATHDREMAGALGINQAVLFTATLFLGAFLAGLGGALQTPRLPANPQMDITVVVECFVVTVIGGMGSIPGAFVAALLIGQLQAFGILVLPKVTIVLVFLLMAVVLVVRPWGLFGKPDTLPDRPPTVLPASAVAPLWPYLLMIAFLAALPLIVDEYSLKSLTELMVNALFAASLMFIVGTGGLVSFGHAAYFGLGAYGAGLVFKSFGAPMELALCAAPLLAFTGAAVFGLCVVRLEGVYLAMLSLAVAQIVYAVAYQWSDVTGGDNGMIGLWPSPWAASLTTYYLLSLVVVSVSVLIFRHLVLAPLGATLAATRDSPLRASAVGIGVYWHRWLAFSIAGTAAGMAGGLQAFMNGSIDPTLLSVDKSVDGLVMLLIGGLEGVAAPLLGAATFHYLRSELIASFGQWRLWLGLVILALVILFPRGLVAMQRGLLARLRRARHDTNPNQADKAAA